MKIFVIEKNNNILVMAVKELGEEIIRMIPTFETQNDAIEYIVKYGLKNCMIKSCELKALGE